MTRIEEKRIRLLNMVDEATTRRKELEAIWDQDSVQVRNSMEAENTARTIYYAFEKAVRYGLGDVEEGVL